MFTIGLATYTAHGLAWKFIDELERVDKQHEPITDIKFLLKKEDNSTITFSQGGKKFFALVSEIKE